MNIKIPNYIFTEQYARNQIAFYLSKMKNSVSTTLQNGWRFNYRLIPAMKIKNYLFMDTLTNELRVPTLKDKTGKIWMSITPMEVQSAFLPSQLATGNVGIGGLGLGYIIQNLLEKPQVTEIHVWEKESAIINWYKQAFIQHPKLHFYAEDIFKMENKIFDFFYMDIYCTMGDMNIISDYNKIAEKNTIRKYYAWGQELEIITFVGSINDLKKKYPDSYKWLLPSFTYASSLANFITDEFEKRFADTLLEWVMGDNI